MPPYRPSPLEVPRPRPRDARRRRPHRGRDHRAREPAHVETFGPRARCRRSATSRRRAATRSSWPTRCRATTRCCARNLLGSLLDVVATNLRHGRADVAVFEIGKGYGATGDEPREWWRLGSPDGRGRAPAWNRAARRTTSTTPRACSSCCAAGSGSASRLRGRARRAAVPPRAARPARRRRRGWRPSSASSIPDVVDALDLRDPIG